MELILPESDDQKFSTLDIYDIYLELLGRKPDGTGLFNCCRYLERGGCIDDIRRGIVASDEYVQRLSDARDASENAPPQRTSTAWDVLDVLFNGAVPASNRTAYRWWTDELRDRRRKALATGPDPSSETVAFVVPLAGGRIEDVLETIASVKAQGAPRWRVIVLAETVALAPSLRAVSADTRIQILRNLTRIAAPIVLERALRASGATMVCMLSPGERLADVAVDEIMRVRDADIVLSDGDRLGPDGKAQSPDLTGAWDPDAALAREPAGLVAIRLPVLQRLRWEAWFRAGAPSRWDALVGAAVATQTDRIRHVPVVLLHRPMGDRSSPPRRDIVERYLRDVHRSPGTSVVDQPCGRRRVVHPIPRPSPLVSIIVPTRDQPGLLRNCVEGILGRTEYDAVEVIIVDNDSQSTAAREVLDAFAEDQRITVLREAIPFNWGKLNAAGVRASKGDVLVFLNDDIDVTESSWLRELVSQASRPDVGLVGAKLLYPSGGVQHAGIVLDGTDAVHVWRHAPGDYAGYGTQLVTCRTVSAVTGACIAMRRSVLDEVGGFEQEHLAVTWGDIDLCLRVRRGGYRVVWTPHAVLQHIEQATRGPDASPETLARIARERAYMQAEWGSWLGADPYFSPHLNPTTPGPTLRVDRDVGRPG